MPSSESRRLEILAKYAILDTPPEEAFDDLAALAAHICHAPIALITLVDEDRQWFKSRIGWETEETARAISFCAHAIQQPGVFIIPDARQDPRFADNPIVAGEPNVRFYAGCPLVSEDGEALGTLCVLDREPRELHPDHERALRILSRHVMTLLELRRNRRELAEVREVLAGEASLRVNLEHLSQLTEHIHQVFWITDLSKNRLLYLSPAYERIWGRTREGLYADPFQWLNAVHPEDRDRVRAALPRQVEGSYREEYRIVRPDGSECWILDRAFPVRNERGEVYLTVGVADDISDQKRLEQELRTSEAGRRAVWESALDAIITMDREGCIVEFNPAAERTFGYGREAAIGQPLEDLLIPPRLREHHRHGMARHLATGDSTILGRRIEVSALRADGTEFPAELTVVRVSAGTHALFVGTVRDITLSKRAHEALLKERMLSDEVINTLPGVFYLLDEQGRFIRWNENLESVTGYLPDEIAERHPLDFFRDGDRELLRQRIGAAFATGQSDAEAHLVSRDGRATPYYFTGKRIEWDGRPCLIGMGVDISALRRAEAERDRLFNLSPDMLCIAGLDGYFRQLNPAWEQTLGVSRAELMAKPYIEFVHPDDRERTLAEAGRDEHGMLSAGFENRYRCGDGSFKWLSWSSVVVPEAGHIYAIARDVTAQKETALALQESEERYRGLVEGVRDGIFTLAADGTIISANYAFQLITGWSRDEWIGRPFHGILHPEDQPRALQLFLAMMGKKPGSLQPVELRFATKEGNYVPMELTATPKRRGDEIVGLLGIARDVRERHRIEEELRQIQKLDSIGRLTAGIAHDFNNLLTVQQGYLSLLLTESGLSDTVVEHIQEVAVAADRAAALTRQLLLFSRKRPMQRRRFHLNDVATTLSKMLERAVGDDITLRLECDDHLPAIEGDPSMMEQVLMNLVVNARDAMPGGGLIQIAIEAITVDASVAEVHPGTRPGRFVRLTVADTGHGIPPELQEKIFDPFFTTKELAKGTGLGLSTVYGIVQQHEGWIDVESEVGRGATFRVHVPAAESTGDPEDTADALPVLRGGAETILAVDDEPALRRIVQTVLERYGYRVLMAEHGVEALELWHEHGATIDLLLTDLVMPHGISGWNLAERLRAERPGLKVLVMSGYDPKARAVGEHQECVERRVAFLQKPYRLSELVQAVRDCLDA